jgi:hypothetical protein
MKMSAQDILVIGLFGVVLVGFFYVNIVLKKKKDEDNK